MLSGFGVDGLGERLKPDPALSKAVKHGDEVAEAPAEPVELPDDKGIPDPQGAYTTGKGGPLRRGACEPLVLKDVRASRLLQRGELQRGRLVVCAGASVAVFRWGAVPHHQPPNVRRNVYSIGLRLPRPWEVGRGRCCDCLGSHREGIAGLSCVPERKIDRLSSFAL